LNDIGLEIKPDGPKVLLGEILAWRKLHPTPKPFIDGTCSQYSSCKFAYCTDVVECFCIL